MGPTLVTRCMTTEVLAVACCMPLSWPMRLRVACGGHASVAQLASRHGNFLAGVVAGCGFVMLVAVIKQLQVGELSLFWL